MRLTSLIFVSLDLFLPDKPILWQASTSCGLTVTSVFESIDDTVLSKSLLPHYQKCKIAPNYFFFHTGRDD